MKEERIKIIPLEILFKVYNVDRTKNRKATWFMPLEMKINRYKENINTVVIDLNSTGMFLEYDWLVKYNPEVKWTKKQYGLQDA